MFGRETRVKPSKAKTGFVPVQVYGTAWCAATQSARRYLDRIDVPYDYHDMELDPSAADRVRWWTGGDLSHPTIQVGGDILIEPSLEELKATLEEHGMI